MFSLGLGLGLYSYQTRICQEGQRVLLQFKFAWSLFNFLKFF